MSSGKLSSCVCPTRGYNLMYPLFLVSLRMRIAKCHLIATNPVWPQMLQCYKQNFICIHRAFRNAAPPWQSTASATTLTDRQLKFSKLLLYQTEKKKLFWQYTEKALLQRGNCLSAGLLKDNLDLKKNFKKFLLKQILHMFFVQKFIHSFIYLARGPTNVFKVFNKEWLRNGQQKSKFEN
jgi:hypothetical protein